MIDKVAAIPLVSQPGTEWRYSIAADIQGYIVEKLSGQPLGAFLRQRIFTPLGMKDTGFWVPHSQLGRLATSYAFNPLNGQLGDASAYIDDLGQPPHMESGGGGLVSTAGDYARFSQMLLNGGELDGVRILQPETVRLMRTNQLPADLRVDSNGSGKSTFNDAVGFGLDFMVVKDPRAAALTEGKDTMSWGGAAGTWFWIDPTNDVLFVGMIQRMGGTGGDDLGGQARTLTYQALLHPET